jgi:predicted nucleic acid-binding protein
VIDASVALAWHLEDETSEYADAVLDRVRTEGALAPSIWQLEVANGLLVAERRGRTTAAKSSRALALFEQLPINIRDVPTTLAFGTVFELARELGRSAYDACYLELATRESLPLATQDTALRAAAEKIGVILVE